MVREGSGISGYRMSWEVERDFYVQSLKRFMQRKLVVNVSRLCADVTLQDSWFEVAKIQLSPAAFRAIEMPSCFIPVTI